MRKVNPLYVFTGLSIVSLAALAAVTYDRWGVTASPEMGQPVAEQLAQAASKAATPVAEPEPQAAVAARTTPEPSPPAAAKPAEKPAAKSAVPEKTEPARPERHEAQPLPAVTDPERTAAPPPEATTKEIEAAAPIEPRPEPDTGRTPETAAAETPDPEQPAAMVTEEQPSPGKTATAPPPAAEPPAADAASTPAKPEPPEATVAEDRPVSAEDVPPARSEALIPPAEAEPPAADVSTPAKPEPPEATVAEDRLATAEDVPPATDAASMPRKPEPPATALAEDQPSPGKTALVSPPAAEPSASPEDASPARTTGLAAPPDVEPPSAEPAPSKPPAKAPAAAAPAPESIPRKPSFDTVRVEPNGDAVAAGEAAPGAEVTLKLNGEAIGTATANADGAWVVIPDQPLPEGPGALTVEQKTGGGASIVSDQTVAIAVPEKVEKAKPESKPLVALVEPDAPARIIQAPEPRKPLPQQSVALDAIDYTDKGDIVFAGRAEAGAAVRLYVDDVVAGDAVADASGEWIFKGGAEIEPGNHALRVDRIDDAGKVVSRVELPFLRESASKAAAAVAAREPPPTLDEPAPVPVQPNVPVRPEAPARATPDAKSDSLLAKDTSRPEPPEAPEPPPAEVAAAPPAESASEPAAAPAKPEPPRSGRVVIQPGNNLWKLSRVIYGRGIHYTVIYRANKDQIRNAARIYPGQIFTTPNARPPEAIDPKRKQPLTVEEGGAPLP